MFSLFCFHTPAHAACAIPTGNAGDMIYSHDYHVLQYCDGTNWIAAGPVPGSGDSGSIFSNGMNAANVLAQPDFTSSSSATTQSGTNDPEGVAWDSVNNRLFVTDDYNNRVLVYDLSGGISDGMNASYVLGQPDFTSNSGTTTQSGMSNVFGVAYDSTNNRLFVADTSNDRVLVYDLSGGITNGMNASHVLGQINFTSSGAATTQSGMNFPAGVAYDSVNKRLFVADFYNNRVLVYDLSGGITDGMNAANVLGQPDFTSNSGTTTQSGMSYPFALAWDSANNHLFVADSLINRVLEYDLSGGITDGMNAANVLGQPDFTSSAAATTQASMHNPQGLAYDSTNDRLFVADSSNNRVLVFNGSDGDMCSNVTNGLVGWWKFDDGSGTSAADSSGNGLTGTLNGGISWTSGKISAAVQSDGANGSYIKTPAIDLSATNAVTVSAWVNRTYSTVGSHTLWELTDNLNNYQTGLGLFPDDQSTCGGYILVMLHGNTGYNQACFAQPSSGVWHFLTAVYDKSQPGNNEINLYIDGVLQTPVSRPATQDNTNNFANDNFYMFSRGGTAEFNAGKLDDVRVYNRALSATEIKQLYNKWGNEGDILYNHDEHVLQYCDGATWRAMGPVNSSYVPLPQQAEMTASDGAASDQLGYAVALSSDGNTALIGARGKTVGGTGNQGVAYIFTYSGGTWTQAAELTASDGAGNDRFGSSVSLSADGSTALIGAPGHTVGSNAGQGAAYIFDISNPSSPVQKAELTASDGAASDGFGTVSLSSDGNTALIGALGKNSNQGAAYVFTNSGGTWTQTDEFTASDGAGGDVFGYDLALSGDGGTALIGAPNKTVGSNTGQGAAYIFTYSGSIWSQTQELTASDGASHDAFGISVALGTNGNTALIGASGKTVGANSYQGAAYVFTYSGSTWTQAAELTAADGAASDYFGFSASLSGDGTTGLIGADNKTVGANTSQGAAYLFTNSGGAWTQEQELTASDGAAGDNFGISVSLSTNGALTGAFEKAVGGNTWQGAAYYFATLCANPAGREGDILYNSGHSVMQYCNGTNWIGIGK